MFGVVPRPLWEKQSPPDERNRVANACRCLLLRTDEHTVLIDTGCGDRFDDRGRDIFAVDTDIDLRTSLSAVGVEPADITHVLFTHLHFDHSAGALVRDGNGLAPLFPQATHLVQRGEFEDALAGRSIMRASYLADDLTTLTDDVSWQLICGDDEVLPGVRVLVTGGHTQHHQAVLVHGSSATVLFPGDILPTQAHLSPYWVMAYDMFPHDTLLRKQALTRQAADNGWIVAWDHDPDRPFSRLAMDDANRAQATDWEAR